MINMYKLRLIFYDTEADVDVSSFLHVDEFNISSYLFMFSSSACTSVVWDIMDVRLCTKVYLTCVRFITREEGGEREREIMWPGEFKLAIYHDDSRYSKMSSISIYARMISLGFEMSTIYTFCYCLFVFVIQSYSLSQVCAPPSIKR